MYNVRTYLVFGEKLADKIIQEEEREKQGKDADLGRRWSYFEFKYSSKKVISRLRIK